MSAAQLPIVVSEIEPAPEQVRLLEEWLYAFNVEATGIADGQSFGLFLRGADGTVLGGAYGWSWARPAIFVIFSSRPICAIRVTAHG